MVDEFILYDTVQYTSRDWRNRNLLKTPAGTQWITVPVSHESRSQRICDTKIQDNAWRRKHWQSLCHSYSKAAFFDAYRDTLEELYMDDDAAMISQLRQN